MPVLLDLVPVREESGKDVLVNCFAPWCGHCQRFKPKYQVPRGRLEKMSYNQLWSYRSYEQYVAVSTKRLNMRVSNSSCSTCDDRRRLEYGMDEHHSNIVTLLLGAFTRIADLMDM